MEGRPATIEEIVSFPSGRLRLEGVLEYPEGALAHRSLLVLSPHPHFAGEMQNNVVRALARTFAEDGCVVLRFDYRGVGRSQAPPLSGGSVFDYWREVEEHRDLRGPLEDALAALDFLRAVSGRGAQLSVAGYSFGALCAIHLAARAAAFKAALLVAPPWTRIDPSALPSLPCPALVVQGDRDFLYDNPAAMVAQVRMGTRAEFRTMRGKDHFFRGEERGLARELLEFDVAHTGAPTT